MPRLPEKRLLRAATARSLTGMVTLPPELLEAPELALYAEQIREQYELADPAYVLQLKGGSGQVRSVVVPGFEIPIRALFDPEENLRVLRQILGPAGR